MSPEDIAEVTARWTTATSEPHLLRSAIAEHLCGTLRVRDQRAGWIIQSVTGLAAVLERPGIFESAAADLLAQRPRVTSDELASERAALLAALDELCGPLDGASLHSWNLAIGLFDEIVATARLDPFRHDSPA